VTEILKAKQTLENNLCNLFAILTSLCDSDTKNQIENMTEYLDIESELDSIKIPGMIKQLVYTGSTNDLNKSHNRVMAHLNHMNLYEDRFKDIQEFHNQYIALKKVCVELGLRFGRCKEHALAILKEKGKAEPSKQDVNKTLDKLEEEHHAIIFVYKTDRTRYGKYLQQMKNELQQHKDPFPKTVADASRILAGWDGKVSYKDQYKTNDANDGVAFATTSEEEENKSHKKKTIMCYKFKNTGHYANECPGEEIVKTSNKKGSSLLIYKNNKHDSSSDEEDHNYRTSNNLENIHTIIEGSNEEE